MNFFKVKIIYMTEPSTQKLLKFFEKWPNLRSLIKTLPANYHLRISRNYENLKNNWRNKKIKYYRISFDIFIKIYMKNLLVTTQKVARRINLFLGKGNITCRKAVARKC